MKTEEGVSFRFRQGIALRLHLYYGDTRSISKHWAALVRYAEHLIAVAARPSCVPWEHGQQNKSCSPTAWLGLGAIKQPFRFNLSSNSINSLFVQSLSWEFSVVHLETQNTSLGSAAVCNQFGDWLAPHIGCAHGCPCSGKPQYSVCPVPQVRKHLCCFPSFRCVCPEPVLAK